MNFGINYICPSFDGRGVKMSAKKQQIKRKKKGTSKPRIADVKTQNPKHATCASSDVRSDTP